MERTAAIETLKQHFGRNLILPDELNRISEKLGIAAILPESYGVPDIPEIVMNHPDQYLVIPGVPFTQDNLPLTLARMRTVYGTDPEKSQPCFYNQDWYLNEAFATETTLEARWYILLKSVPEPTRARDPEDLLESLFTGSAFPSAILTAYVFFAWYFLTGGEKLWDHDFLWCSDHDHHGDRIYTGRYTDPAGINRNGFNIHRHLKLREQYGAISVIN